MLSFAGCQCVQVLCFPGSQEKPCKETQRYSLSAASSLVEPVVCVSYHFAQKKHAALIMMWLFFVLFFLMQVHLRSYVNRLFAAITCSAMACPTVMCQVFHTIREAAVRKFPSNWSSLWLINMNLSTMKGSRWRNWKMNDQHDRQDNAQNNFLAGTSQVVWLNPF